MTGRFNDDPVRDFIVDKEVATISDHLDGFGDAKLKKYGAELLALIAKAGPRPPDAANAGQ